jgi:hypothetical protein
MQKYILFILLVISLGAIAQPYGNEWININGSYYKFKIPKTGIYKITNAQLLQAGIPLSNFSPQNIQLFFNGKEIPCYIKGENQGVVEYILFYAKKNNGQFDVGMYDDAAHQTNPYHSLITDTAAVFFTWNTSFNNKRFQVVNDNNFTGYEPVSYCFAESFAEYTKTYYPALEDCEYVEAEGWFDNLAINLGQTLTKKLPTPGFVDAGIKTNIELAFISFSTNGNIHHVNITAPNINIDTIFTGYRSIKINKIIDAVLDNETSINFKNIDDMDAVSSKIAVSYIKINYTRNFNAAGDSEFNFSLPASSNAKQYIEISEFLSKSTPYLFDLTNNKIISVTTDNNLRKALVPASTSQSKLILIDEDKFLEVEHISESKIVNHSGKNSQYLIITNKKLWESAVAYANYRNAYLVDINELYNQFGYGIEKHPMAIRNFLNYIYHNWNITPKYLFIIGKATESHYARYNDVFYQQNLVPTMGFYGSDVLLSNKIVSDDFLPAISTGRLAAQNNSQVYLYLNKIMEFESNGAQEWMKRAIHFGGGVNEYEQEQFAGYLRSYENTFKDSLFGGYVSTFLKHSSDPIEISKNDSIKHLIEGGVSLLSFFGHGSAYLGFDQNIDDPEAYNNKGKYPLMLANSCYSGNIHLPYLQSKSEEWILIEDKGAIGFLAVVGHGLPVYLNKFSSRFYQNLSYDNYGAKLGDIILNSRKEMQDASSKNRFDKMTIQEFILHGDPAILLNSFELPDLKLNDYEVSFSPANITTAVDSFYIYIVTTNQGKTTGKQFSVEVIRNNQFIKSTDYYDLNGMFYKDTFRIKMPVDKTNGIGNNQFTITIDPTNIVAELSETNNTITVYKFISSTDIVPVVPYKYSISPTNNITLKASSADAFAKEQTTVFQIDTSYLFNSPLLYSENITHKGGVVEWNPPVSFQSGITYFWRAAKNTANKRWSESSFISELAKTGWNQSNYGQFKENHFMFLEPDDTRYEFVFSDAPKTLICKNIGSPGGEVQFRSIAYTIDGIGAGSSCGPGNAMILVVIDSLTLLPWQSDYGEIGEVGHINDPWCSNKTQPQNYFIFSSDNIENIRKMTDFVKNKVHDGNYILIYSFRNGNFENYDEDIRSAFEEWGANNIRFTNNYIPYIFFAKKGYTQTAQEVIGTSTTSEIELTKEIKGNFTYGAIISNRIGPSKEWKTLNWSFHKKENNSEEIAFVKIYGINNSDKEILLKDSITSLSVDLSDIDASIYSYLQLEFYTKDEQLRTPAHLDKWEILYKPVTDLAINPAKGYEFYNDTLHEGENGRLTIAFENIGYADVDSITVKYWLQSNKNEITQLLTHKISPLNQGESIIDTVEFSTLKKQGNQNIWIEINPDLGKVKSPEIREQYYFNNIAQKPFYVKGDKSNPLLDITFDGVHIMDGDLISASPEIVIQLKDENRYIPLNDTSIFSFYIKSHKTGIEKKISIGSNPDVTFIPGKLPENKAQIVYNTHFDQDGIYELRVQAKDVTGNESGNINYVISFQVINESTITNVFNYPNPFSTSTRFVFELTGSELPDEMRIEILTITGKVIKVIYLEDLGVLHIGKNITEYSWDGTDMYGDPLANGVYFYSVNARINGEEIKIRDTGTGQYFKNGFGKMYIMR